MAAKSSTVMLTASVAAFLLSKEVYIVDAEVFEMICIFGAYYIWYSNFKDVGSAYFNGRRNQITRVLEQARVDHKAVVQERINHVSQMSDAVEVAHSLYDMSVEIAKLEAEAFELKQKVSFTAQVKGNLDQWVRQEAAIRESEQKLLVFRVIEKVKAQLLDPKMQASILQQSLLDIEKLKIAK